MKQLKKKKNKYSALIILFEVCLSCMHNFIKFNMMEQ